VGEKLNYLQIAEFAENFSELPKNFQNLLEFYNNFTSTSEGKQNFYKIQFGHK